MRGVLVLIVAGAVLLGAAAPGGEPPDHPAKFIKVDELKAQLDRGVKIAVFDVRTSDAYADLHIKGARSMPLRDLERRAPKEISKTARVVFY